MSSSTEKNTDLIKRYQAALAAEDVPVGRKLAEEIVLANTGLAKQLGFRYGKPKTEADEDDVLQAAKMGLLRAARDFDPTRGTFATHAAWHIRDYVQRWTGKTTAVVRPRSASMPASIARAASKFRMKEGREPSAAELGVTQAQLDEWSSGTHFVDLDVNEEDVAAGLGRSVELTYDSEEADTQTRMLQLEAAWKAALEDLSPRNRDIADRVLMKGEAVVAVAEAHGLTHGRVMQICKRTETRLKRALNPDAYDPAEDWDAQSAARTARWRAKRSAARLQAAEASA